MYPRVSLAAARTKREEAKGQLAEGIDPNFQRRMTKAGVSGSESFEAVAREWHGKFSPGWAESHSKKKSSAVSSCMSFRGQGRDRWG